MPLYAAYASNLDPRRMGLRCPHSPLQTTGWLTGWRLTFGGEDLGWDGALSTIVEDPIEQVFAKIKALLRKAAARTVDALEAAIASALDAFLPDECANYFTNSGYEPD